MCFQRSIAQQESNQQETQLTANYRLTQSRPTSLCANTRVAAKESGRLGCPCFCCGSTRIAPRQNCQAEAAPFPDMPHKYSVPCTFLYPTSFPIACEAQLPHAHKPITTIKYLPRASSALLRVFKNIELGLTISRGGGQGTHSAVNLKNKTSVILMAVFGNSRKLPFRTCKVWQNHRRVWRTKERKALLWRTVGWGYYQQKVQPSELGAPSIVAFYRPSCDSLSLAGLLPGEENSFFLLR